MSPTASTKNLERTALLCAAIFGACAIGLCFLEPHSVATACRLAIFTCLAPAIGCATFTLIHRITGGQWTAGLAPFLRAGVAVLPWIWVAAAPVLLLVRKSYAPGLAYEGFAMLAARAVLFGAFFFWLRWALSGGVGYEGEARKNARPWAGPVGMILLFFMLTFLADDWLESLEEGWHSTAFTVVWIAGQAISGLSLCLLFGLRCGARPPANGTQGRPLGLDWGNLLLASIMFWTYVTFAQYLIIWAGNLPEETSWFLRRDHGVWAYVTPAVGLVGFAFPFFMLLSRRLKQSTAGLAWVASLLLGSQLAYTAWVIVPVDRVMTLGGDLLVVTLLAGALGLFANQFARAARLMGVRP
jgi:hypothetical protein